VCSDPALARRGMKAGAIVRFYWSPQTSRCWSRAKTWTNLQDPGDLSRSGEDPGWARTDRRCASKGPSQVPDTRACCASGIVERGHFDKKALYSTDQRTPLRAIGFEISEQPFGGISKEAIV